MFSHAGETLKCNWRASATFLFPKFNCLSESAPSSHADSSYVKQCPCSFLKPVSTSYKSLDTLAWYTPPPDNVRFGSVKNKRALKNGKLQQQCLFFLVFFFQFTCLFFSSVIQRRKRNTHWYRTKTSGFNDLKQFEGYARVMSPLFRRILSRLRSRKPQKSLRVMMLIGAQHLVLAKYLLFHQSPLCENTAHPIQYFILPTLSNSRKYLLPYEAH